MTSCLLGAQAGHRLSPNCSIIPSQPSDQRVWRPPLGEMFDDARTRVDRPLSDRERGNGLGQILKNELDGSPVTERC